MSASRKRRTQQDGIPIKEKKSKKDDGNTSISNKIQKRAGTINQIILKNFMCHSHLEVNFKNNINYIIGRNGSGKSAILTALVVGLSGKANVTNRGTNVKGFIKAGKTSATIEIVLNNDGIEAYRPSVYGNQIIIQRQFAASGSSTYKVKTATGQRLSKSAKDIKLILENLNIQIDNPVCILNQDTSRNFLSTNDPKQKFLLFMRATRLESLREEYRNILNNRLDCARTYKDKEEKFEELKNLKEEFERKIKHFEDINKLKIMLKSLNDELLWAKARDVEDEFKDCVKVVGDLQNKCKTYEDNSKNKSKRLEEIKQKVSEFQRQIVELQESAEVQNRPQIDLQNEIDGLKQSYSEKKRSKQQLLKQIQDKNTNIVNIAKEIENFTANLSKIEQEKLTKKKEMSALEEQIKHIENMIKTTQNDIFQTRSSINRQEERESDIQRELKQKRTQCGEITEKINTLKNESNSLVVYGRSMPQIINMIQRNKHKFIHLPRGPLGDFINIKDKKWAVAVEGYLGTGLLHSFTVDNKKDNAVLMDIFNKHWSSGQKPTVIIGKFFDKVHDIRPHLVQADKDCISLYNAIDIKDPVVANCLIDQMSIESILLLPSTERAIELLSNRSRVPRNCRQGVTINGDKYYPDPNYKMYASRYHRARFLQVDAGDLISANEEILAELANHIRNIQEQMNAVISDKLKQKNILEELTKKFDKLKQTNFVAKRKLETLSSTEDLESVNIQSLENEMSELKGIIQQLTTNIENIEQEMEATRERITNAEDRLKGLFESAKKIEDRIAPLEQQIKEQSKKKQELDVNSGFEKKRMQEVRSKLEVAKSKMTSKQDEMGRLKEEASICERMDKIRRVPEIVTERNNVQSDIRKAESSSEDPADVKQKYQQINSRCTQVANILNANADAVKELRSAVKKRARYCKCAEDYYVNFTNHTFSKILQFRQFKGSLEINMDDKKLDLVVIPQQGSQGHTVASNLSGGERSFSTVAFLYALWQCTNFPFYFLDEFDVFMDKINRTKVMEILIHHAKERPDRQYVFLTPQDVSFIHDEAVSIDRLEDPQRRIVPEA